MSSYWIPDAPSTVESHQCQWPQWGLWWLMTQSQSSVFPCASQHGQVQLPSAVGEDFGSSRLLSSKYLGLPAASEQQNTRLMRRCQLWDWRCWIRRHRLSLSQSILCHIFFGEGAITSNLSLKSHLRPHGWIKDLPGAANSEGCQSGAKAGPFP